MELPALLVALLLCFLLWKRQSARKDSAPVNGRRSARRQTSSADKPFESVCVRACESACLAAYEIEGQRFLVREAPRLPLDDCDSKNCECRFVSFPDRRESGDRRTHMIALDRDFATKGLPKRGRGRRKTDR